MAKWGKNPGIFKLHFTVIKSTMLLGLLIDMMILYACPDASPQSLTGVHRDFLGIHGLKFMAAPRCSINSEPIYTDKHTPTHMSATIKFIQLITGGIKVPDTSK